MPRFVAAPASYTAAEIDDIMEIERPDQESSLTFGKSSSGCGTTRKSLRSEPVIQNQTSRFRSPTYEMPTLISDNLLETKWVGSQYYLPPLSTTEQWDLEGFFQIVYTLSAFAFPPDTTPWETYSPLIINAFFSAADDEDQLFTDNVLAIAFQNCADVFATYYEWPEHTKTQVFARHSTGNTALAAVLQLVKLARGFGIDGEEWWELRRSLRIAFAEPFQRNGWVSEESDIFHKLFTQSLQIFLDLGVKPGTWTFTIVGALNSWRKVKEAQESVAAKRNIAALKKRIKVESAWETLRVSINGDTENTPQCSSAISSPTNFENDNALEMSSRSHLCEQERMKPLPNLQQRGASSLPEGPPSTLISASSNLYPSYGSLEENCPTKKACITASPIGPDFFSAGAFPQEYSFSIGDITDPGFGDLPDLHFGDTSDVEAMDWDESTGMVSNVDIFDDEGFESQQPMEITKCYLGSHEEICGEALRWSGKQLWEMTDEEFRGFCSRSPPWE